MNYDLSGQFLYFKVKKEAYTSLSIYYTYNQYIAICLLHKMLKKIKIITNAYWIVDSTYTISNPDRCTSFNMSTDRPSRATLDYRNGGGDMPRTRISYKVSTMAAPSSTKIKDCFKNSANTLISKIGV